MDAITRHARLVMAMRRRSFGAVRCALRDFGTWARSGATPRQCLRQAFNTFRAFA